MFIIIDQRNLIININLIKAKTITLKLLIEVHALLLKFFQFDQKSTFQSQFLWSFEI